jgi:hypothetical protein
MSQSTNQSVLPDENSRIEVREVDPDTNIPTFEFEIQQRDDEGTWIGTSRYTLHLNNLTVEALTQLGDGLRSATDRIFDLADNKRIYIDGIAQNEAFEADGHDTLEELTE